MPRMRTYGGGRGRRALSAEDIIAGVASKLNYNLAS